MYRGAAVGAAGATSEGGVGKPAAVGSYALAVGLPMRPPALPRSLLHTPD